jgi:hypothetical protein
VHHHRSILQRLSWELCWTHLQPVWVENCVELISNYAITRGERGKIPSISVPYTILYWPSYLGNIYHFILTVFSRSSRPNSRNPVFNRDILFCATVFALNRMSLQLYLYALGAIALTRIHEVGLKHIQPLLCARLGLWIKLKANPGPANGWPLLGYTSVKLEC